ncbi:hypothetical protein ABMA27_011610 [Loxostege sticticalis]|uniref:Uncharacterized protein n=1 Tax=Loxostege sticticalis TaxID=481309 RepID=A0ABR3IGW3_LOXSC
MRHKTLEKVCQWLSQRLLFFGRNSGIHGLRYLFRENSPIVIRLFWVVILLISSGCLYLLLVVERGGQVNFTPETRYLPWTTAFPAVTVCEAYSLKPAQRKFSALYPTLMDSLSFDVRKYLTELLYGRGTCGKSFCVPCGIIVPCGLPWREIMENVRQKCTDMIADCRFNGQEFPCCKKFRLVDSEYGYCFSFNTLQNESSRDEPLYTVNRTTGPGLLTFRLLYDAYISVHSPEELSTNNLDIKFRFDVKTRAENRVEFLFSMVEMQNDPVVLTEDIGVRECRVLEEVPEGILHTYPVYSYGACRLAQETEHTFEHCGCIHPVRHSSYKHIYCNYTGLNCIVNIEVQKQKLGTDTHEPDDDACLPSCFESELTTIHIARRWVNEEYKGTLVSIRMASLPTLRYKRNLVRTHLDIVVSIGGMVGLFFSASVLSIVEVFYLIFRPKKKL